MSKYKIFKWTCVCLLLASINFDIWAGLASWTTMVFSLALTAILMSPDVE